MKKFYWLIVLMAILGFMPGNRVEAHKTYLPVIYNNYCPNPNLSLNFLAFGDSITGCYYDDYYGWLDYPGSPEFPGCGYERRVYDWLNAHFGFCPGKLAYYNYGRGGEETSDGLARFLGTITNPQTALNRLYPSGATVTATDLVIIMEGTNDLNDPLVPDGLIEWNLSTMVSQAKQAGKKVIIATIPPSFDPDPVVRQQRIDDFNYRIWNIGIAHQVPVADVYSSLAGHPEYMSADGLHPNAAGFDQIATEMYLTILDNQYWTILDPLN